MLQIAKTSLLLKRKIRKDEKVQPSPDSNPFLENLEKYKIFSPKTLHKLLYMEKSTWSDSMIPLRKTVFGALLFADISGFTRLSAHLSAEELKLHINHYFSLLLGAVYQHYGDIIKFCGDAIIVMWPIPEDSNATVQQAAVELAVKCSLHLINVCGQYDHKFENGPPVSLRLHCGVGCGRIHCMCLGDNDRWEFLISGDALTQVGLAEAAAGIGEVCISAEAFSHVGHLYPTSTLLSSGNYLLDMQSMDESNEGDASPNVTGQLKTGSTSPINTVSSQQQPVINSSKSKFSTRFTLFPTNLRYQTTSEDSVADNQVRTDSEDKYLSRVSFSLNINYSRSQGTSSISIPSPVDGHRRNPSIPSARRNSLVTLINQVALAVAGPNSNTALSGLSEGTSHRTPKSKGISCRENPRFLDVIHFLSLPGSVTSPSEAEGGSKEYVDVIANNTKFSQFIRLFVPEAARTAIEHRSLSYLAELRVVVTSFIQIIGLENDFLQGNIERPQLVISIILSCLKRYGGSLRQYVVDDKGCVVILAFGLPGSSHEDNSIRAIETTARIRHLLNANNIDCKIGITQGRVYCGLVGSYERCEYAMMGSSVNLAARFMSQAALNTIIVSHEIYSHSSQEYEYKTLPKMKAKGYIKPVAAYIPMHRLSNGSHGGTIGESTESRDGFRFVGRGLEMSILTNAFDSFIQNGGRCLATITGAPGVGKSWLLSKFLHYTSPYNMQIYSIVADEYHSNSKYFCIRQLLDQIILVEDFTSPTQTTITTNSHPMTSYKGPEVKSRTRPAGKEKRTFGHSYSVFLSGSEGTDDPTHQYEWKLYNWISKHAPQTKLKDLDLDDSVFYDTIGDSSPISPPQNRRENSRLPSHHESCSDMFANPTFSAETPLIDAITCLDCILPFHTRKMESNNLSYSSRMKICIAIISKILEICILNKNTLLSIENLHWCDGPSLEILINLLIEADTCFTVATLRTLSIEPNNNTRQGRKNSDSLLINSHRIIEKLRDNDTTIKSLSSSSSSNLNRYATQYIQLSIICSLHPLSILEIKTMIEDVISERLCQTYPELLKTNTLSQILMRTGGSPYLVTAFIISLRETLLNGTFKSIDSLPSGEHNIIVNRFDKLTLTQQLILKVASVIGNEFTCDFLSNVLMNIGHDMASSVSGLELTLEKLLNTTLITVTDECYMNNSSSIIPQSSPISASASASISLSQPYHFCPILSSESNHLIVDDDPKPPPIKLYKFTTKTVQECIYNLMLKSQKEVSHNAVAIVMENMSGILPILHFDEIAKHVYSSNNIPKKLLYLEESLKRSIFQDDLHSMKETLQRLILIATGLSIENILSYCCKNENNDNDSNTSMDNNHHHPHGATTTSNYKKLSKDKNNKKLLSLDTPINSIWLSATDIKREIPILPSVALQSKNTNSSSMKSSYIDPFQSISTKSIMNIDSPKITNDEITTTAAGPSSKSGKYRDGMSKSILGRLLDEEDIYIWLLKFANIHFRLGNFKLANNFIILGLYCFKITPIQVEIMDNVHDYFYRLKVWYANFIQIIPRSLSDKAVYEILNSYLILAQINLLRGFIACADGCLQRIKYICHVCHWEHDTLSPPSSYSDSSSYSSPQTHVLNSQIHGLQLILNFLNYQISSQSILIRLHENNNNESMRQTTSIGMNSIYKAIVELSSCDIQNAFLSINYALSCYNNTESIFIIYMIYIIQAWLHIFSGNSLEALRISELAYQHAISYPISTNLLKWVIEIKIVSKIFLLNYNDAYIEWEKLKGYSKRDIHSATSSSLVAMILIHLKDYDQAFLYCKYSFLRLLSKPHTTPISTLYLFFTIYSSLKILDYCQLLTDTNYSLKRKSFTITNNQLLPSWDSIMTSKMTIERAKIIIKVLKPFILDGMKIMKKVCNIFPITSVLYNTLLIVFVRIGLSNSSSRRYSNLYKIDFNFMKDQLQPYQSFKFGMAYYHRERSLTLYEYGEKYHEQAQQAEDLSNRLFRDTILSGNIGSIRVTKSNKNDKEAEDDDDDNKEEKEDEDKDKDDEIDKFYMKPIDHTSPYESASTSSKKEFISTDGVSSVINTPTDEFSYNVNYGIREGHLEDLIEESITNLSNAME